MNTPSSRPLCGYRRLSVDRQGNKIGYEVQTAAVEAWATENNRTIATWFQDKNESAADENLRREGYERMLEELMAGMYSGIAVWRIDRLTRIDEEFLRVLGIARRAGAVVISTDEGLSSDRDSDVLTMKIKVLIGDTEVRGSKRRISANKSMRKRMGHYTGGGRRPYGFEAPVHDERGKVLNEGRCGVVHVPGEVANLRDAARRIAYEGESYLDVINDWHSRQPPIYGATGAPWNTKTLETILLSPRMIAKQECDTDDGEKALVPALWEPVLDEKTWKALVSIKTRAKQAYNPRETYLLTNTILCGRCQMPLSGCQRAYLKGGEKVPSRTYRCPSGTPYKVRGHCGKLSALAEDVERIVVMTALVRLEQTTAVSAAFATDRSPIVDRLEELEKLARECTEQLDEIESMYRARRIRADEWLRLRDPIDAERSRVQEDMKVLSAQLDIPRPTGSEWGDLPRWFEGLSLRQQKALIRAHIRSATILPPGRSGRYFRKDRVVVTPFDIPLADAEVLDA